MDNFLLDYLLDVFELLSLFPTRFLSYDTNLVDFVAPLQHFSKAHTARRCL